MRKIEKAQSIRLRWNHKSGQITQIRDKKKRLPDGSRKSNEDVITEGRKSRHEFVKLLKVQAYSGEGQ